MNSKNTKCIQAGMLFLDDSGRTNEPTSRHALSLFMLTPGLCPVAVFCRDHDCLVT